MSDNYLRLVPTNMALIPPQEVATACVNLVGGVLPDAHEILAESYGHPVFIDQGANLEKIICSACHNVLSFRDSEDVQTWWYDATDDLGNDDVSGVKLRMPCCDESVLFATLVFEWPAAVASFEISVLNPNVVEFPEETVVALESLLGCRLRQVWAHY